MPSSRQARMTRRATSPRFATRTLLITAYGALTFGPDAEKRLVVLHAAGVLGQDLDHLARNVRGDLVHQLHRLDDAQRLPLPDAVPHLDVRLLPRRRRPVERPHHRRTHHVQAPVPLRRTIRLGFGLRPGCARRRVRHGGGLDGGSGEGLGPRPHGDLQLPLPDPDLADPALSQKLDEPADVVEGQRLPRRARRSTAVRSIIIYHTLSFATGPDCTPRKTVRGPVR